MSYLESTNSFFYNRYKNLGHLAVAPYSWSLFGGGQSNDLGQAIGTAVGDGFDTMLKVIATPVLLPATIVTTSISLVFGVVTALLHGITALGASIFDCVSPKNKCSEGMALM